MNSKGWIQAGAKEGTKLGIRLAFLWMCLPVVIMGGELLESTTAAMEYTGTFMHPEAVLWVIRTLLFTLMFGIVYLLFGSAIGVLPAMLTGAATGALLGAVLRLPHIAPYRWNRVAVGIAVGLLFALLAHTPMVLEMVNMGSPFNAQFWYFWGGPWWIFAGACAWFSDRFPALVKAHYSVREFSTPERAAQPATEEP